MDIKSGPLFALTIIYLLGITAYLSVNQDVIVWEEMVSEQEKGDDPGRNERSTPREFVLPSTAAVAEAQESKHLSLVGINQEKCFRILRAKGHQIISDALLHNVDLARALVIEQRAFGIEVTGRLDLRTAERLECINA